MAAIKGAMTSSQTIFLPTEEPENSRINFRDSLKFFQEQLVINGANFPAPSPGKLGNDTLRKNGSRSINEKSLEKSSKIPHSLSEDIHSAKGCKIDIPTVDTILESVRVLRAIQKSQEERGSSWSLDIALKSNIETEFNLTEEWIRKTDINKTVYSDKEVDKEMVDETESSHQVKEAQVNSKMNGTEYGKVDLTNSDSQHHRTCSNVANEACSFWPNSALVNNNSPQKENVISELAPINGIKNCSCPESGANKPNHENSEEFVKINFVKENENSLVLKTDPNTIPEQVGLNGIHNNNVLDQVDCKNLKVNESEKVYYSTPDSLRTVCTNLLNYLNTNTENKSGEDAEESNIDEILKIETYEDTDAQKDDYLLNESLMKNSCLPNDSSSIKIDSNDSDSGVGTQRSVSSLSPNNPSHMHKDSWSDSCSSHYASAECSPYHSLNNVFESSVGLSLPGETKVIENSDSQRSNIEWEYAAEKIKATEELSTENLELQSDEQQADFPSEPLCVKASTDTQILPSDLEPPFENAELDTEISYCSFITSTTIENPCTRTEADSEEATLVPEVCDNFQIESEKVNGHELVILSEQATDAKAEELPVPIPSGENKAEDDVNDLLCRTQKFTAASCDLVIIVETLYRIKENSGYQTFLPTDVPEETFQEELFILSKGAFCEHPEGSYRVIIEDFILYITKDSQVLCSLNVKYAEISMEAENIVKLDNRMGRCVFIKSDCEQLKNRLHLHCLKHWQTDCLQLVHYPLKCHQNVVIIDLGSCSTRAGILMDQPTLPSIFFPTVCATDKTSGNSVYGMEALQSEVRHRSNLSFPIRPTNKITKHTVDIKMLEGLFKKIFCDLKIDPTEYAVQVCLPRNLSINTQTALVKLLLEDLKVKAVSMTNQALLTLYAHDVSTAVVVDIGDRTDVLPVVDGFIVESGVTQLPHGGQRLIHHMKHGLAEKRISLSNDIDSFLVQYITESLAYVADDYENEMQIALQYPDVIRKTVALQPAAPENQPHKNITLEEARFKIPEGLFNPDLWGLDSPGIHHLVQKAIQATSVDARRQVAENIYVSGGVTMLPGFVERLSKEIAKLSKTNIVPKVYASNYRYHCTYIGACKFAKMDVFSQVCISLEEYSKNSALALKKCALYF